ncbi:MAG: hypothetical protein IPI67_35835 [Myxococcales bacterium]|nr:hypothetical protein [Myxococcales bacterium]
MNVCLVIQPVQKALVRSLAPLVVPLVLLGVPTCNRSDPRRNGADVGFDQSQCRADFAAGRYSSAATACDQLMTSPGQHAARAVAAQALLQLGEYSKAETVARHGAESTNGERRALFLRCGVLWLSPPATLARQKILNESIRQAPDSSPDVYLARARWRFIAGAFDSALDDVRHAQRIAPEGASPELMLGYLLLREGPTRYKDAAAHFARAAARQPTNARAAVYKYVTTGDPPDSAAAPDSAWGQALLDLARRGAVAKEDLLKRAAESDGKHAAAERRVEIHMLLGTLAETQNDVARARIEYASAVVTPVHSTDDALARARLQAIGVLP